MPARAAPCIPNGNAPHRTEQNGLKREHVADIQRARMLAAAAEVAAELGAGSVTVAQVVERAGISRRTFYEVFDDCEDCLRAAFDNGVRRASEQVLAAYRTPGSWTERVRRALTAALSFFDADPSLAWLLMVESLAVRASAERRAQVMSQLVGAIDAGRGESKTSMLGSTLTAEGVLGAVMGVIQARLSEPEPCPLVELLNPLMSMIVLPYMGAAAARRELERGLPDAGMAGDAAAGTGNPLEGLNMRLTYRTMRVLQTVAVRPGSSNRLVGDASGIADQGQISKLLGRLEKLGLVENLGTGAVRGEPNAWMLTRRGEEVHDALTAQAAAFA